ncbi:Uncharacterized protein XB17_00079 [Leptospira santarosai]|nr:Uncharacterized protein XB17_00079 [Leptospira santarosai]
MLRMVLRRISASIPHAGIQDLSSLRKIPLPSKIVVKDQKHFTLRPGGAVEIISPKFLVNLELYP